MKNKGYHLLSIVLLFCLLAGAIAACKRADTVVEHDSGADTVTTATETAEDTTGPSEESLREPVEEDWLAETDEVTVNLLRLKAGDIEPLVGVSFGDVFDYDRYVDTGSWAGTQMYRLKDAEDGNLCYLFGGKGNGFSGLVQFAGLAGGDFLGIRVGEDSVEKIADVLGAYTVEKRKSNSGTVTWAIWDFETPTLSVRIKDNIIQTVEYLAKGDIADAPELPEEETDLGRDRQETSGRVETVYNWSACGSASEGSYAVFDPRDVDYDDNTVDEFIREYLLSQGIYKEEPDRITYDQNGDVLAECYVDEEKGEYCIILHIWGHWLGDFDAGTRRYLDALYCTTHTLGEEDIRGYMIYEEDTAGSRRRERLYDDNRQKMAEVTYEYMPQMPFPLILESWNLDSLQSGLLIRNQKTWFMRKAAGFDEEGKFIAYNEGGDGVYQGEYLCGPCRMVYDGKGRITAIQEELQEEDLEEGWRSWEEDIDFSGQIEIKYRDDGTVSSVEYFRPYYRYGTSDSSGVIEYDEQGRMLANEYYITHGSDINIYLYEDDGDMPWCMICWCSSSPGFADIYLFLPQEP